MNLPTSMFSVRQKVWSGLGTVVQDAPNSKEAIKLAGLDWTVSQRSLFAGVDNEEFVKAEGFVANVRDDTQEVLGVVSSRYKVVQNKDAFAFTDALIGENDVRYETAGLLSNGKAWLLGRMPSRKIAGDEVEPYLVFTNGFDGKSPIQVALTPIRIWCSNTLNFALKTAKRSWTARHTGSLEDKLREAEATLLHANQYMDELADSANEFLKIKIDDTAFIKFVEALFPISEKDGDRKTNNIIEMQNELTYRYQAAPDVQKFRGTAWGVIQAVTDMINHTEPRRKTSTYQDKLFGSIIGGHPVVDTAVKMLQEA
jgi:phage/plasmid-like protein (TIGR03299 family)